MQTRPPGFYHPALIRDAMRQAGLPSNTGGICQGYVMMGIQAFLSNDLKTFQEQIQAASAQQDRPGLKEFLDGISKYSLPAKYRDTFQQNLHQGDIEKIAEFTASETIKKQQGLKKADSWPGIYTPENLKAYLRSLDKTVKAHDQDVVFKLSGHNHTVAICYQASSKSWHLVDVELRRISRISFKDIAKTLTKAFQQTEQGILALDTSVITLGANNQKVTKLLQDLRNNADFTKIHTITPETANLRSEDDSSLAQVAAAYGHVQTAKQLIQDLQIRFDLRGLRGISPLASAARRGNTEILQLAKAANMPFGSTDDSVKSPIYCAMLSNDVKTFAQVMQATQLTPSSVIAKRSLSQWAKSLDVPNIQNYLKTYAPTQTIVTKHSSELAAEREITIIRLRVQSFQQSLSAYPANANDKIKHLRAVCDALENRCVQAINDYQRTKSVSALVESTRLSKNVLETTIQTELKTASAKPQKSQFFTKRDPMLLSILTNMAANSKKIEQLVNENPKPLESIQFIAPQIRKK